MEFRLLGTVCVDTLTGPLPLGPAKRRSLLAALLLRANTPVSMARLTDCLWDDAPPLHARTVIQGHVSRLRALLTGADAEAYGVELATLGDAYVLRAPETLLDSQRFEELLMLAREQRSPADTVLMLKEALSLWQGPALTGTYASTPLQAAAHALEESRLTTVEQLAHAYAVLGEHHRAAAVLRAEADAQPLRESLAAALMTALYRSGRQSEALDRFHRTRRLLADELGIDPGRELADAYAQILRGDPDPAAAGQGAGPEPEPESRRTAGVSGPVAPPRPPRAVPPPHPGGPAHPTDLLPRAPRGFHGRGAELTALSRAAAGEAPVCLLTGPAGVGKTALALHWARRSPAAFPDGRLFADLRGFGDTGEPTTLEVLREFLLALGVAPRRVPESVAGSAALFRSLTDRLSLLVVLDNVRDSAQVRQLLPGGADCVTLITSRHRLEGLIASDAAVPVPLDVLEPLDGTALLAGVLGEERVRAEPVAARRLAELCGGLPLALRVTAARLAGRPQWTLAAMADELADERSRLSLLAVEDTGVSAALRLTVQQLPPDALHHFTRLGHHPGSRFDPYTAAALAGSNPVVAAAALERLAAAHLIAETGPGHWELHDLVRLYARGLDPAAGPGALIGVLDHYIATALAAADTAEPGGEPCFLLPDGYHRPAAVRDFTDRAAAMDWLAAEREDLSLAAAAARGAGLDDRAWRIILLQWPHVVWRARDGWAPMLELALAAAAARSDPYAESRVRNLLGWVLSEEGRITEAADLLEPSPGLARRAGDRLGEATALINLAIVQAEQGGLDVALEGCGQALELARKEPDAHTEMLALQHLARMQLAAGRPQDALDSTRAAFDLGPEPEEAARRVLLTTVSGEARLALGAEDEGVRLLDLAAADAERAGYDEGAVRALEALLRVTAEPVYVRRYEAAVRRLADDG
ncbi:BTAD domain-containing putative transcriptional regulator [Streptomyces sp. NBC_00338]|uniref:AfsR/SARP family transcriptional regulator n=1 Tax=unclassified Streptomyces TaxID=2593676 RepID=UPI002251BF98|nr:BTAD domain-containing putative transcriptional regulator [Streptomyces sp. NBC_00338]MCX5141384.1 tetratricopeptide repeat protein [Streptomyces sp. NBC_00338]WSU59907.1 tetratricopeptide repeat protein [Streptomyces sp. NBC_01104]